MISYNLCKMQPHFFPDTAWCRVRAIIAILLVILAVVLVVEGVRALSGQRKTAQKG